MNTTPRKNVRKIVLCVAAALLLLGLVVIPYGKVLILTALHGDEFADIPDPWGGDPVDVKVYEYHSGETARVLVVSDNGNLCDMNVYTWDSAQNEWCQVPAHSECKWTHNGGNAHELYWPMFHWSDFFAKQ